jgi:hypothetical protein
VKGMTSKAGKSFDANISLSPEKGIVFDFNNQKQEVQIEKKQPESTLKIPLLDDSAYRGNLKRTPSIHPNLKGMVDNAVANLKKSKELDKPIAKGRKAVIA